MAVFPNILEPPPLPGLSPASAPARFGAGQSGRELLGIIFRVCRELRVSDIQMRASRPVYIHTNKGMEKLDALGTLSAAHMDEILKELIANRESGSHGFGQDQSLDQRVDEKIRLAIEQFSQSRVADFSCDGIPMSENGERSGRLRIQAHLSSSGLGVTCRILNDFIPELEALGIDLDTTSTLRHGVLKRAGLCLVTGPTGSGKSTTLASLIDWARRHHPKHIVTVEDPIEYQYPDDMDDPEFPGHRIPSPSIITQQEVGRDVHSYRQGLKDVLRKAPHIILLGEIRDREAMETCMEAAQTGHLVLSTLHANTSIGAYQRLANMGVPLYLVSEALSLNIYQRLLRRIHDCGGWRAPDRDEVRMLGMLGLEAPDRVREPSGCPACNGSGYLGRSAAVEVLQPDPDFRQMVAEQRNVRELARAAESSGFIPIHKQAHLQVMDGRTSVAEMFRSLPIAELRQQWA